MSEFITSKEVLLKELMNKRMKLYNELVKNLKKTDKPDNLDWTEYHKTILEQYKIKVYEIDKRLLAIRTNKKIQLNLFNEIIE